MREPEEQEARTDRVLELRRVLLQRLVRGCGSWAAAEDCYALLLEEVLARPLPAGEIESRRWLERRAASLARTWRGAEARRLRAPQVPVAGVVSASGEGCGADAGEPCDPRPLPEAALLAKEWRERFEASLARLPEADRRLLRAVAEGLPTSRLAAAAGVSRFAVHRRLRRARARLLALLPPDVAVDVRRMLTPRRRWAGRRRSAAR